MEASITLKKVGKLINDKTILAGLNFGIERGSLVAIIGDNEAGKSLLLKVISSSEYQEYGQVFIHGVDSKKRRSDVTSKIGYMPHELDLDPWLTLEQNIRFFGLLHSVSLETINTRMVQFSRDLHIVPYLGKMVKDISPGIIRMGMIVRALVHDPEILILDDPTAFMDAESYRHTWDLLLRLKGEKTILYVSQSLQEVESAHDRILVLENGRIALDGSLDRFRVVANFCVFPFAAGLLAVGSARFLFLQLGQLRFPRFCGGGKFVVLARQIVHAVRKGLHGFPQFGKV